MPLRRLVDGRPAVLIVDVPASLPAGSIITDVNHFLHRGKPCETETVNA